MPKGFLTDIDLNGNQLLKAILEVVASNPTANLAKGRLAFNSASNVPIVYDGSAWQQLEYKLGGTQTAHNHVVTLTGDVIGSGNTGTTITANLKTIAGLTAATYNNVATQVRPFTIDVNGRITAIGNAVTIAPAWGSVTGKPTTISGYGLTTEINNLLAPKLDKSIFDDMFEKVTGTDSVTRIHAKYSFYSDGEISAFGAGSGGTGGTGTSYSRLDSWDGYDAATMSGYVLSAALGVDLNTRINNLSAGAAMSVSISGTGNAVTNITQNGATLTVTMGANFAILDGTGKIPSYMLPSFVDDVIEGYYVDVTHFYSDSAHTMLITGEKGKIYTDLAYNKNYRWGGSAYVYITSGAVDSVNGKTGVITLTTADISESGRLYFTNARAITAPITGYTKGTNTALVATDTILSAFGKLEGQIASKSSTVGTVTSVGGTGTVSGLTLSGTVTASGSITLGGTLSVLPSNFSSQAANTVLAAPSSAAGVPTFRTLVAADIPNLDAGKITSGTLSAARGGTGLTNALGGFARKVVGTFSTSATSYTIAHGLGSKYAVAQVKQVSDGAVVECDIKIDATNAIFTFNVAPTASAYEYTIVG